MSLEPVACLKTLNGESVPLSGVTARGRLQGLLLELTVEQHYRNEGNAPIESVYTFPLPATAVLLGFELDLGGRNFKATAVARKAAERRYEEAVDKGDSAALLTQNDEGLYTANLANLMPGETAVVRYRYAEYLSAHRGTARLRIPTAITPRYGNPAAGGLEGASVPRYDPVVEYPFELEIDLPGVAVAERLRSPSHALDLQPAEGGLRLRLAGRGWLDRDFVLELDGVATQNEAFVAKDGTQHVVMATATVPGLGGTPAPLAVKLLVDCSGSMLGASIRAAREALLAGLDQLDPQDRVSLTLFGTEHQHLTEGLEPADDTTLTPLRALVRGIQADLGGTNMEEAVDAVLRIPAPEGRRADVLLVTDGAVHEVRAVVRRASDAGQRLFVVMIGAAPNEALGKRITEETGGSYAFVSAGENPLPAILRMFRHLREAPRTVVQVDWPVAPAWVAPLPSAVFSDEPFRLYAGFAKRPEGHVTVTVANAEGAATSFSIPLRAGTVTGDLIPRMGAVLRLPGLTEAKARDLAERYQLASRHTSFVLVAERAEGDQARTLPVVKPVPQMPPASLGSFTRQSLCMDFSSGPNVMQSLSSRAQEPRELLFRRMRSVSRELPPARQVPRQEFLLALIESFQRTGQLPVTLQELFALCGEPAGYRRLLLDLSRQLGHCAEDELIRVFVAMLTRDARATRDVLLGFQDELWEQMDFGVSTQRKYRDARQFLAEKLASA